MSRAPSRFAFTLVEVIASIGIFAIAFLVGASAISAFLLKQEENYQRTVASSAAMLIVDAGYRENRLLCHGGTATGPNLVSGGNGALCGLLKAVPAGWYSKTRFKGGPPNIIGSGDYCFVFYRGEDSPSDSSSLPLESTVGYTRNRANSFVPLRELNIAEYRSLIVVISGARSMEQFSSTVSATVVKSPDGIEWRRMTFWYGYAPDVLGGKASTVTYLGTFLYADGIRDYP